MNHSKDDNSITKILQSVMAFPIIAIEDEVFIFAKYLKIRKTWLMPWLSIRWLFENGVFLCDTSFLSFNEVENGHQIKIPISTFTINEIKVVS